MTANEKIIDKIESDDSGNFIDFEELQSALKPGGILDYKNTQNINLLKEELIGLPDEILESFYGSLFLAYTNRDQLAYPYNLDSLLDKLGLKDIFINLSRLEKLKKFDNSVDNTNKLNEVNEILQTLQKNGNKVRPKIAFRIFAYSEFSENESDEFVPLFAYIKQNELLVWGNETGSKKTEEQSIKKIVENVEVIDSNRSIRSSLQSEFQQEGKDTSNLDENIKLAQSLMLRKIHQQYELDYVNEVRNLFISVLESEKKSLREGSQASSDVAFAIKYLYEVSDGYELVGKSITEFKNGKEIIVEKLFTIMIEGMEKYSHMTWANSFYYNKFIDYPEDENKTNLKNSIIYRLNELKSELTNYSSSWYVRLPDGTFGLIGTPNDEGKVKGYEIIRDIFGIESTSNQIGQILEEIVLRNVEIITEPSFQYLSDIFRGVGKLASDPDILTEQEKIIQKDIVQNFQNMEPEEFISYFLEKCGVGDFLNRNLLESLISRISKAKNEYLENTSEFEKPKSQREIATKSLVGYMEIIGLDTTNQDIEISYLLEEIDYPNTHISFDVLYNKRYEELTKTYNETGYDKLNSDILLEYFYFMSNLESSGSIDLNQIIDNSLEDTKLSIAHSLAVGGLLQGVVLGASENNDGDLPFNSKSIKLYSDIFGLEDWNYSDQTVIFLKDLAKEIAVEAVLIAISGGIAGGARLIAMKGAKLLMTSGKLGSRVMKYSRFLRIIKSGKSGLVRHGLSKSKIVALKYGTALVEGMAGMGIEGPTFGALHTIFASSVYGGDLLEDLSNPEMYLESTVYLGLFKIFMGISGTAGKKLFMSGKKGEELIKLMRSERIDMSEAVKKLGDMRTLINYKALTTGLLGAEFGTFILTDQIIANLFIGTDFHKPTIEEIAHVIGLLAGLKTSHFLVGNTIKTIKAVKDGSIKLEVETETGQIFYIWKEGDIISEEIKKEDNSPKDQKTEKPKTSGIPEISPQEKRDMLKMIGIDRAFVDWINDFQYLVSRIPYPEQHPKVMEKLKAGIKSFEKKYEADKEFINSLNPTEQHLEWISQINKRTEDFNSRYQNKDSFSESDLNDIKKELMKVIARTRSDKKLSLQNYLSLERTTKYDHFSDEDKQKLSEEDRINYAESLLGRKLTQNQRDLIIELHRDNTLSFRWKIFLLNGADILPGGIEIPEKVRQIQQKMRQSGEDFFSYDEAKILVDNYVCGGLVDISNPKTDWEKFITGKKIYATFQNIMAIRKGLKSVEIQGIDQWYTNNLFFIIEETTTNARKYNKDINFQPTLKINKKKNFTEVIVENSILEIDIPKIEKHLQDANKLTLEELEATRFAQMESGQKSEGGTAGLGWLTMALKVRKNFDTQSDVFVYEFKDSGKVSEDGQKIFIFKVKVNFPDIRFKKVVDSSSIGTQRQEDGEYLFSEDDIVVILLAKGKSTIYEQLNILFQRFEDIPKIIKAMKEIHPEMPLDEVTAHVLLKESSHILFDLNNGQFKEAFSNEELLKLHFIFNKLTNLINVPNGIKEMIESFNVNYFLALFSQKEFLLLKKKVERSILNLSMENIANFEERYGHLSFDSKVNELLDMYSELMKLKVNGSIEISEIDKVTKELELKLNKYINLMNINTKFASSSFVVENVKTWSSILDYFDSYYGNKSLDLQLEMLNYLRDVYSYDYKFLWKVEHIISIKEAELLEAQSNTIDKSFFDIQNKKPLNHEIFPNFVNRIEEQIGRNPDRPWYISARDIFELGDRILIEELLDVEILQTEKGSREVKFHSKDGIVKFKLLVNEDGFALNFMTVYSKYEKYEGVQRDVSQFIAESFPRKIYSKLGPVDMELQKQASIRGAVESIVMGKGVNEIDDFTLMNLNEVDIKDLQFSEISFENISKSLQDSNSGFVLESNSGSKFFCKSNKYGIGATLFLGDANGLIENAKIGKMNNFYEYVSVIVNDAILKKENQTNSKVDLQKLQSYLLGKYNNFNKLFEIGQNSNGFIVVKEISNSGLVSDFSEIRPTKESLSDWYFSESENRKKFLNSVSEFSRDNFTNYQTTAEISKKEANMLIDGKEIEVKSLTELDRLSSGLKYIYDETKSELVKVVLYSVESIVITMENYNYIGNSLKLKLINGDNNTQKLVINGSFLEDRQNHNLGKKSTTEDIQERVDNANKLSFGENLAYEIIKKNLYKRESITSSFRDMEHGGKGFYLLASNLKGRYEVDHIFEFYTQENSENKDLKDFELKINLPDVTKKYKEPLYKRFYEEKAIEKKLVSEISKVRRPELSGSTKDNIIFDVESFIMLMRVKIENLGIDYDWNQKNLNGKNSGKTDREVLIEKFIDYYRRSGGSLQYPVSEYVDRIIAVISQQKDSKAINNLINKSGIDKILEIYDKKQNISSDVSEVPVENIEDTTVISTRGNNGEYSLVKLNTLTAIQDVGNRQKHCLGKGQYYEEGIDKGIFSIFSITKNGEVIVSIKLDHISPNSKKVLVKEIKNKNNSKISKTKYADGEKYNSDLQNTLKALEKLSEIYDIREYSNDVDSYVESIISNKKLNRNMKTLSLSSRINDVDPVVVDSFISIVTSLHLGDYENIALLKNINRDKLTELGIYSYSKDFPDVSLNNLRSIIIKNYDGKLPNINWLGVRKISLGNCSQSIELKQQMSNLRILELDGYEFDLTKNYTDKVNKFIPNLENLYLYEYKYNINKHIERSGLMNLKIGKYNFDLGGLSLIGLKTLDIVDYQGNIDQILNSVINSKSQENKLEILYISRESRDFLSNSKKSILEQVVKKIEIKN